MSGLDTRGALDGALRGFELMDRHYYRKGQQERLDRLDAQNEQRYQDGVNRQDRLDKKADERYQAEWDRNEERHKETQERLNHESKLRDEQHKATLAASHSTVKYNTWRLDREKSQAWLSDNSNLITQANDRYIESGGKDVDPILEHEFIKGGPNDIRSYTGEMFEAATQLEGVLPKVLQGELDMNDPAFIQPLGKFYENRIKVGIGDKDETGKEIADKTLTHVTHVADIDPNRAGDQPGMVLGVTVKYTDGTTKVKPVTENRSTAGDDTPLVVPVEQAMQNLTQRLAKAKAVNFRMSHPEQYKKMLQNQEDYKQEVYRNQVKAVDLKNDEFNNRTDEDIDANIEQLNDAAAVRYGIETNVNPGEPGKPSLDSWVSGNAEKAKFLTEIQARGFDSGSVPLEKLDQIYRDWLSRNQKTSVAQSLRATTQ